MVVFGPKRSRGRPKKHPVLEEDPEFPEPTAKRKRGRPRKYDINGEPRPPRPRRKPRKEEFPRKYQCIMDQFVRPKGSKKSYVCKTCDSGVKVRGYIAHHCCLAKHLMEEHGQVYEQVLQEAGFCAEVVTEEINKIIEEEDDNNIDCEPSERTCGDCGRMFNSRQGMQRHWTTMHSRKNLKVCHVCGEGFTSIVALR